MGKYHLFILCLVAAQALSANPLTLKMEGKFVDDADGPRTVHEWNHTVYAEPGQTTVADEARRKICTGKDCATEEFRTHDTRQRYFIRLTPVADVKK